MDLSLKTWRRVLTFCIGLLIGTAFCMKWMEGDFVSKGQTFTIIGLEIGYPKEKLAEILSGLDITARTILGYHLHFDYVFMAAVYPGIAALCMIGRSKLKSGLFSTILGILAFSQILAWGADIYENDCLLGWMKNPEIGDNFGLYHLIVSVKWLLALSGAALGIFSAVRKSSNPVTA